MIKWWTLGLVTWYWDVSIIPQTYFLVLMSSYLGKEIHLFPLLLNGANMSFLSPRGKALRATFNISYSRVHERTCHYYLDPSSCWSKGEHAITIPYPFFMTSLARWFVSRFLQSYKTKLARNIENLPSAEGMSLHDQMEFSIFRANFVL